MNIKKKILQENETKFNKNIIHNLSTYPLKNNEHRLLSKGLNFSPNISSCKLQSNPKKIANQLQRKINARIYAQQKNSRRTLLTDPFSSTKNWTPPNNNNATVNKFIQEISKAKSPPQQEINYTPSYTDITMKQLKNNKIIIIKKADKGGGLCILDKNDYIKRIYTEHLNDNITYKSIDFDPTPHITYDTITLINFLHTKHHIDDITKQFLTPNLKPRTPIFYGIPKIHKINSPLRPIVSGFDSPTDNLSKYVTHYLQPLTDKLPSFIKDTKHFLQLINDIPLPKKQPYL